QPRVVRHNLFEFKSSSEDGFDAVTRLAVSLSNVDSHFSQVERSTGWKGSRVTVRFVFYDLKEQLPVSDPFPLFLGVGNPPEEITETEIRLSFTNRLSLQRSLLPEVRIQRRCPWLFPQTGSQRAMAVDGGPEGKYGLFHRCGYSPDQPGGVGNLVNGQPYLTCDYSRTQCEQRGMFKEDSAGRATKRFGGIEFVPSSILARSFGENGRHVSTPTENAGKYNDFVPLVYGTAWYYPPVVFARNDGNLTRMEVLLGGGQIEGVIKVIANDVEIPAGQTGQNMTGTGWYNVVTDGGRNGGFNLDFTDAGGAPLGDPYGSMAYLSLVLPNRISDGDPLPKIKVLLRGLKLPRFDTEGAYLGEEFTNNPAWVLLDVCRRSGWRLSEIDMASFAAAAEFCSYPVQSSDVNGNPVEVPRYQCNLVLSRRRSAAEVVRGIRSGSMLGLGYGRDGKLRVWPETTLALQQPQKPEGSNSTQSLDGGWPAYEFGDGTGGSGGILRRRGGEPTLRIWSRSTADTANRVSAEFQDQFNEYQQDSLSLVDVDDVLESGQEVARAFPALGLPGYSQAGRVMRAYLDKSTQGNTYVEFETTVKGLSLRPGDIVALTYLKEGFDRQPFRILRVAPGTNYATVSVMAQIHEDRWYETDPGLLRPGRRAGEPAVAIPRPFAEGDFAITESSEESADGSGAAMLAVSFVAPPKPSKELLGTPLIGFSPDVATTGGTLPGNATYYYAVSALDGNGGEGALSFVTRAGIPALTSTNRVTLKELSFPSGATGFRVYRGSTPQQLLCIANQVALGSTFVDLGATAMTQPPPDANYDHANFYWRLEARPEHAANIASTNSIGHTALQMVVDEHRGMAVRITAGKGAGQEALAIANTATAITIAGNWAVTPDSSSKFAVSESAWHFAASAPSSPVRFEVPNRAGTTVQVLGRPANVFDEECPLELCTVARWQIGGANGLVLDSDVADAPVFGLSTDGQGNLEIVGVAFPSLERTRSIQAGTLTVGFWNELNGPSSFALTSDLSTSGDELFVSGVVPGQIGQWLQTGREVMIITEVLSGGDGYRVTRGSHGSNITAHPAGTAVYHLDRRSSVIPFARDFFGSPASGNYAATLFLPNTRVSVAELFVTNARGNSGITRYSYTALVDQGLRTLSGGQYAIQVEGYLAVQSAAAPPLVVERAY
ncbi:MAG TPA: hypothetical protein DEH78_13365, partial [Solibacterales bacterium]|nr:hypothetical protein [Bryobacterales bacterium]